MRVSALRDGDDEIGTADFPIGFIGNELYIDDKKPTHEAEKTGGFRIKSGMTKENGDQPPATPAQAIEWLDYP